MAGFLTVVICCFGLVLDLGLFEIKQLQLQNAADAAALGAAYSYENGTGLTAGGVADGQTNGYVNGINNVTLTIANPPTSGYYAGNAQAIQATVSQLMKPFFLPTTFTVSAQAVAFMDTTPCLYLMSQYSTANSLNAINQIINGNCPFYIGKNYYFNGGASNTGDVFYVAGSSANSTGTVTPAPNFGAAVMTDPLAYVTEPVLGSCTYTSKSVTAAATLSPGTYCGGLSIQTSSTVTLNPGMYIIDGTLNINGPKLVGTGVTIYMTQGNGYTYGTSTITNINSTLSAPTSGVWQGLLYFADRSIPAGKQALSMSNWNPSSKMDGIFYLIGQEIICVNLPMQGNAYIGIVADYMQINNTGLTMASNYTSLAGGNPFRPMGGAVGLVQ